MTTLILCFNTLYCKTSFSSQHITSHRTAPHRTGTYTSRPAAHAHAHRTARPRRATPRLGLGLGHGPARPGEASERARVWFTVLLLPALQVVYTKSTF